MLWAAGPSAAAHRQYLVLLYTGMRVVLVSKLLEGALRTPFLVAGASVVLRQARGTCACCSGRTALSPPNPHLQASCPRCLGTWAAQQQQQRRRGRTVAMKPARSLASGALQRPSSGAGRVRAHTWRERRPAQGQPMALTQLAAWPAASRASSCQARLGPRLGCSASRRRRQHMRARLWRIRSRTWRQRRQARGPTTIPPGPSGALAWRVRLWYCRLPPRPARLQQQQQRGCRWWRPRLRWIVLD